jgi:hypothetical protein
VRAALTMTTSSDMGISLLGFLELEVAATAGGRMASLSLTLSC